MKRESSKQVICIVGPTASGKTTLSLNVAERLTGEIVSADSRQVYRYMDIGTAKPNAEDRNRLPHHCIDILDPDEPFSAGEYGKMARNIVEKIHNLGKITIVVGGSGLYIRALIDGMFAGKFKDEELRMKLEQQADEEGLAVLFDRLESIDPESARRIHPNDRKRIIRALEATELAGMPMSQLQSEHTLAPDYSVRWIGLNWPRSLLYHRIEDRVDVMIDSGLIEEVERLREMGYSRDLNSMDSLGYKEVFAYLDGELTQEGMHETIKQNTRRFAKRQMTWFRRDDRIRWYAPKDENDLSSIALDFLSGPR